MTALTAGSWSNSAWGVHLLMKKSGSSCGPAHPSPKKILPRTLYGLSSELSSEPHYQSLPVWKVWQTDTTSVRSNKIKLIDVKMRSLREHIAKSQQPGKCWGKESLNWDQNADGETNNAANLDGYTVVIIYDPQFRDWLQWLQLITWNCIRFKQYGTVI